MQTKTTGSLRSLARQNKPSSLQVASSPRARANQPGFPGRGPAVQHPASPVSHPEQPISHSVALLCLTVDSSTGLRAVRYLPLTNTHSAVSVSRNQ